MKNFIILMLLSGAVFAQADLTGQAHNATYGGLLHLSGNTGLSGTLQTVYDGLGVASPLQLSTTTIKIPTPFTIGSTVTSVTAAQLNFLSGLTDTVQEQLNSKVGLTSFSSTATGLTYTNTTGVFSWTANYFLPTDSMATVWNGKTDTTDVNNLIAGKVDTSRTLTINGLGYSLGANRSWTISTDSTVFGTIYYINNQGFLKSADLTGYFLTSNFPAYFSTQLGTKTLDSLAAGTVNVHLTTSLKSTYDGYASTIGGKLDTTLATTSLRANWTQAYTWGNHALEGYADSSWVAGQLGGKADTTYLSGLTSNVQTQINGKEPSFSVLSIAKGGTNNSAITQNKFLFYNGTRILASGKDSTSFILSTYLDDDTTLAANSSTKIATQKATRAFVDSVNTGRRISIDNGFVPDVKDRWVYWDSTSGAGDCFMSAGVEGEIHTFKKIDSSTVALTLYPDGSETIDHKSIYILNKPYQSVTIQFSNLNWHIVDMREFDLTIKGITVDTTGLQDNYRIYYNALSNTWKVTGGTGSVANADSLGGVAAAGYLLRMDSTGVNGYATQNDLSSIPSLSDGDKGDISVSGSGATWTIDNTVVSFAKIQNINQNDLLGRYSAGTGAMQQIKLGTGFSFGTDTLKFLLKTVNGNSLLGTGDISLATLVGYTPLDKADSTDAVSYVTRKQFTDGQLLKVNLADSSGVNGYATQDDLGVKVNKVDSTGVNGYATQDDLNAKVNKADSTGRGYATQDDLEKLTRIMEVKLIGDATATAATDSLIIVIPSQLNGYNLVDADAYVTTVSSSGTPTFTLTNVTDTQNMLSTNITIDANEFTSFTADAQPAINASYDDVATGDRIKIKCTVTGTGAKGSGVILVFQKP